MVDSRCIISSITLCQRTFCTNGINPACRPPFAESTNLPRAAIAPIYLSLLVSSPSMNYFVDIEVQFLASKRPMPRSAISTNARSQRCYRLYAVRPRNIVIYKPHQTSNRFDRFGSCAQNSDDTLQSKYETGSDACIDLSFVKE